jgi:hypothetical protein
VAALRKLVEDAGKAVAVGRPRSRECALFVPLLQLETSRAGDFNALLAQLDPDVVLPADHAAVLAGATAEVRGASAVANTFAGRARVAKLALIDGSAGAVWAPGGRPRVVFRFTFG